MESDQEFGLSEDWHSVVNTLESIIPVYDKTNRYISFGTDVKIRNEGLRALKKEIGRDRISVLDLGCGTGKMSQLFFNDSRNKFDQVILADPLRPMLTVARSRVDTDGLICVYEDLPIRSGIFDAAMAGFSLRDARKLSKALLEINTLLKDNGKFLIVDLCKPDSKIKSAMISTYWKLLAPIVAFFAAGKLGFRFGALHTTYKRLPKNSEILDLMRKAGFEVTLSKYYMLGGACFIILTKRV